MFENIFIMSNARVEEFEKYTLSLDSIVKRINIAVAPSLLQGYITDLHLPI